MHWWLMCKIPLLVYGLILLLLFFIHPAGALFIAIGSLVFVVPWGIFARWVCKEIDRDLEFNGRKGKRRKLKRRK